MTTTSAVWMVQFMWDGTGEWMRYMGCAAYLTEDEAERVLLLMAVCQPNRKFRAVNNSSGEIIEQ